MPDISKYEAGEQPAETGKENKQDPFASYYVPGEPGKAERAYAWQTAIGLQAVDGLSTSSYLINIAKANIEGTIDIAKAKELIDSYYKQDKSKDEPPRTEEADKVAARITEILAENSFVFSPAQYLSIHQRLFMGIYHHAGKIRNYNITKKEWVLNGASVVYGGAADLRATLDYDFRTEKEFSYDGLSMSEIVKHLARFVSRLWQIHVFGEGNTRTTAVFFIKYLRTLGFKATNDIFAQNAWYFRNALVRANYSNLRSGIYENTEYLENFLRNLLMGESHPLRNRFLHIDWKAKTTHSEEERHIKRHLEDVDGIFPDLDSLGISAKTRRNIRLLRKSFGKEKTFGRKDVQNVIPITEKPASTLIKKMAELGLLEKVAGMGKGKYRFIR